MENIKTKIHSIADHLIIEHTVFNLSEEIHGLLKDAVLNCLTLAEGNDKQNLLKFIATTKGAINTAYSFEKIKQHQYNKLISYFDEVLREINSPTITNEDIKKAHYE